MTQSLTGPIAREIEERLRAALAPTRLAVINDSARHQGHAGDDGSGESHFTVEIEADKTTVVKEQITTSGRRTAAMLGQVSRTFQEVQRPLLTPDECLRMRGPRKNAEGHIEAAGDMVVYVAGFPAIYGKQPLYFQDPVFRARAAVPPPAASDRLVAFAEGLVADGFVNLAEEGIAP